MNILDQIVASKKVEVEQRKQQIPVSLLEKSAYFQRKALSMSEFLLNPSKTGIIAEFKRQSPSKGVINANVAVEYVTNGYMQNGASALSVLTDTSYFGGHSNDVLAARNMNNIPILRKEFIVDAYQIIEAKSIGADAILLIAACLTQAEINTFAKLANSLGLEVLLELHGEEEFEKISTNAAIIGINNRNLKTFEVDLEQSKRLAERIPNSFVKVAESGIDAPETIRDLKKHGFKGFLIGECFMKATDPVRAFADFVSEL